MARMVWGLLEKDQTGITGVIIYTDEIQPLIKEGGEVKESEKRGERYLFLNITLNGKNFLWGTNNTERDSVVTDEYLNS